MEYTMYDERRKSWKNSLLKFAILDDLRMMWIKGHVDRRFEDDFE